MDEKISKEPRALCPLCALKHIAKARTKGKEIRQGYGHYFWYALAELSEAEDELLDGFAHLSEFIRQARKAWERNPFEPPDFDQLVKRVSRETNLDIDKEMELANKEIADAID